jgi:hypothetical protein
MSAKRSEVPVFVKPKVKKLREVNILHRLSPRDINKFEQQLYRNYYPTLEPNKKQS